MLQTNLWSCRKFHRAFFVVFMYFFQLCLCTCPSWRIGRLKHFFSLDKILTVLPAITSTNIRKQPWKTNDWMGVSWPISTQWIYGSDFWHILKLNPIRHANQILKIFSFISLLNSHQSSSNHHPNQMLKNFPHPTLCCFVFNFHPMNLPQITPWWWTEVNPPSSRALLSILPCHPHYSAPSTTYSTPATLSSTINQNQFQRIFLSWLKSGDSRRTQADSSLQFPWIFPQLSISTNVQYYTIQSTKKRINWRFIWNVHSLLFTPNKYLHDMINWNWNVHFLLFTPNKYMTW